MLSCKIIFFILDYFLLVAYSTGQFNGAGSPRFTGLRDGRPNKTYGDGSWNPLPPNQNIAPPPVPNITDKIYDQRKSPFDSRPSESFHGLPGPSTVDYSTSPNDGGYPGGMGQTGSRWAPPKIVRPPPPPVKNDNLWIMTQNAPTILALFGRQPPGKPFLPQLPSNGVSFPYVRIHRFCTYWWWVPMCRCFFNWMYFCYPIKSHPWCWYWYGCWY